MKRFTALLLIASLLCLWPHSVNAQMLTMGVGGAPGNASHFVLKAQTAVGSTDSTDVTTSSIDTTGADLLVAVVGMAIGATDGVVTDSKSNTWTARTLCLNSITSSAAMVYYSKPTSVGSGHTFTFTRTTSYPSLVVLAFSGSAASSVFDQESCNAGLGSSATSGQPGALTVTSGYLVIAGGASIGTSPTIGSGFASFTSGTNYIASNPGEAASAAASYFISTGGSVNPNWTFGSSGPALSLTSFKVGP